MPRCGEWDTCPAVREIEPGAIFAAECRIEAETVRGAAGVIAAPIVQTLGLPPDRASRFPTGRSLTAEEYPEVSTVDDLTESNQVLQGVIRGCEADNEE